MLDKLFPDVAVRINKLMSTMDDLHHIKLRVSQGLRTFEEQDALYEQGRITEGPVVTYASGGKSFHNYGLAADLCFVGADPYLERIDKEDSSFYWKELGKLGEGFGLTWGGRFSSPDRPHFHKDYGFSIQELKTLYDQFGLEVVHKVINEKLNKEIL